MNSNTFENLVARLSEHLMAYDPGDLVCLSDIIDLLGELKSLAPLPELTGPLFEAVLDWLDDELAGFSKVDSGRIITDFVDLVANMAVQVSSEPGAVLPDWVMPEVAAMVRRIPARVDRSALVPPVADLPGQVAVPGAPATTARPADEPASPPDVNGIFFHEARERLKVAQTIIIDMESCQDSKLTNELFRVFHTIKGEAGFLGYPLLGNLSHQMENLLDRMRQGQLNYDSATADHLLQGTDLARQMIDEAESGTASPATAQASEQFVRQLADYLAGQVSPLGNLAVDSGLLKPEDIAKALEIQKECGWLKKLGEILVEEAMLSPREVESILARQKTLMGGPAGCPDPGEPAPAGAAPAAARPAPVPVSQPAGRAGAATAAPQALAASGSAPEAGGPLAGPAAGSPGPGAPVALSSKAFNAGIDEIVNVKAGQIRFLIDMVGELLINLQQLDEQDRNVMSARKIARNLQYAAMQLGTVRIGTLFGNMKRVARDAARQSGKEFDLVLEGETIEVDRNLVERLGEPLMHLVRNAVAHGLEADPADRVAAGKPAKGRIVLRAERKGQHVMVSVIDDGNGVKAEKVLKKALEQGLLSLEDAQHLNPDQIRDFIFRPGFSTAEQVDGLSGRGVGMDVVRAMVESMRGSIRLHTEEGLMTRVSLSFPINMAIIEGMIIRLAHRFFVIPVGNIVEAMELQDSLFHALGRGVSVLTLRGETMPVLDLAEWFGLEPAPPDSRKLGIIVESRERRYAMLVHEIISKREVVIKPLGSLLAGLRGISSGTILQGGRIGLVVDVDEVVKTGQGG